MYVIYKYVHIVPFLKWSTRVCVIGKNYSEHVAEFVRSGDESKAPVMFCKPFDAIVDTSMNSPSRGDCIVPYPPHTRNLHYEAELVIAIGTPGMRTYTLTNYMVIHIVVNIYLHTGVVSNYRILED